jgi:hypothetical protein
MEQRAAQASIEMWKAGMAATGRKRNMEDIENIGETGAGRI